MKLLYVPCGHPLQEADDCLTWQKLGVDWFSTGYYSRSKQPGDLPFIDHENDPLLMELFNHCKGDICMHDKESSPTGIKNRTFSSYNLPNIWQFTPNFLKEFDIIFLNHYVENLKNVWQILHQSGKAIPIIVKTFSMHPSSYEETLRNFRKHPKQIVYSVRNSPTEFKRYSGRAYAGHDAIIRGCIVPDEHEVSGWIGDKKEVVTFTNNFAAGKPRRNIYIQCKQSLKYPFKLYGAGNENESMSDGFVTHAQKLDIMRHARVALTTGTPNATNTYSFVEAWVMGLPQVVYGPSLWQSPTYEPDIIGRHEDDILIGNTPKELIDCIQRVMNDDDLAKQMSERSREKAVKVYGRDVAIKKWAQFFDDILQKKRHTDPVVQKRSPHIHKIRR
jgi:glycosyltransferase involved in cell wall biosynthesis